MRLTRLLCCIFILLLVFTPRVLAQDTPVDPGYAAIQQTIQDLTAKLNAAQSQAQTLSSAITYLNNKQALIGKQIEATQYQIDSLGKDIDSLTGKIGVLETSLNSLTATLIHNIQTTYERRGISGFDLILSTGKFSDLFSRYEYLVAAQRFRQDLLFKTTQARFAYDQEKATKEQKQTQIAALKVQFQKQQSDLAAQQQAKQLLLTQTKNSEANYQRLLADATAQLASFKGFSQSMGGGLLPPQNSPDGWYFSQRDQRWGNMCIGSSCGTPNQGTIVDVGCLVTSVAMVKKKYGENVTPSTIAANSSYFFSTTAYMLQPFPAPSGYHYERGGYNQGQVDANLSAGRPVIVHLQVNSRDGHFIVIKSGSGGEYTMHDPWEGYDKRFKDFYSLSQITSVDYLRQG